MRPSPSPSSVSPTEPENRPLRSTSQAPPPSGQPLASAVSTVANPRDEALVHPVLDRVELGVQGDDRLAVAGPHLVADRHAFHRVPRDKPRVQIPHILDQQVHAAIILRRIDRRNMKLRTD